MKLRFRVRDSVVLSLLLAFANGPSLAQIEEIRVSARKLDEDLQRVPIAITAIGAEEVIRKGLVNLDTLLQQTPSLILDRAFGPADQRIVVRGLAPTRGRQNVAILQDGIDISSEAITTGGGSLLINPRLFDLERVEIVTGPQNALYGRSAFNGAINYITRKPGDEFYARVGGQVGNYDNQEVNFQVSGPLTDGLSAGLTGMFWNLDGFYDNEFTGGTLGGEEGVSLAGTVVIEPTETLNITARVEYLDDEFGPTPFLNMPFNAVFDVPQEALDQGLATDPTLPGVDGEAISVGAKLPSMTEESRTCVDPTDASTCDDFLGTEREITRATLTIDWDLGGAQFTSLTHVADAETFVSIGGDDTSAAESLVVQEINDLRQTDLVSQELRLASSNSGPFTWVVGGLYWNEQVELTNGSYTCINYTDLFLGFPNGPLPCGPPMAPVGVDPASPYNPARWERETEHYSLYGLIEWEFLENWKIAFEGRQVWEDLSYGGPDTDRSVFDPSGTICALIPDLGCIGFAPQTGPGTDVIFGTTVPGVGFATEDDDFFAPKLTLTWNASDDAMTYLSFAQAYKPKGISQITGGFGIWFDRGCEAPPGCDPVEKFRFDRERLDAYELGVKTSWADNRLQLNGAIFFQDFKNKQVSQQIVEGGALVPIVTNAGKAEVLGLEFNALWLPIDNLSLSLGYTYLDTEFTEYVQFTGGVGTPTYVGNCTPVTRGGADGCDVDFSGNELEGAPPHSLVGNARWQSLLVGATDWFVETDFQFQDDRFANDQNTVYFPAFWQFNFRAGLVSESLDVIFFVDNAFDDDTTRTGVLVPDIAFFAVDNPQLRIPNRGRLYATQPRTYGLRLTYRFGAN